MRRLLILFMVFSGFPAQAVTYRWVDAQGKVHYGDVLPVQQSGRGHQELDKQGRVLREVPRTLQSPQDRQGRAEDAAARAAQERKLEAQKRQDRALLSTYTDVRELDLARDRALALRQLTMDSLRARLNIGNARLSHAQDQLARYRASGASQPANLVQMRDEARAEIAQIEAEMRHQDKLTEDLKLRFQADRLRLMELLQQQRGSH